MMFVGFGALYAFLRFNGLSGVGFCLVMTPLSMLLYVLYKDFWAKVLDGTFRNEYFTKVGTDISYLTYYCAASVLIAFGTVEGKVGLREVMIMSIVIPFGYALN
jgi:hypothetical protein